MEQRTEPSFAGASRSSSSASTSTSIPYFSINASASSRRPLLSSRRADSGMPPRSATHTTAMTALTLGLPARITAATGIDALVHGIESLASRGANPVSAAYATQAVAMVGRWLPAAHRDGSDREARAQHMLGAHLAGQALTISGLGLVHGIGHALTAHTGTPHGIALAAVLEEAPGVQRPGRRGRLRADRPRATPSPARPRRLGPRRDRRRTRDLRRARHQAAPARLGVRPDMLRPIASAPLPTR
ncbi:iron-containing alcohol dehydrogenase [Streptomyces sp. NPDC048564]|uniref:iron-containing alcohol dehydrogenase n=1 Tax=Streptomyces sp. NPDC048564 TaxID=3155760 RepID=UPI003449B2E1